MSYPESKVDKALKFLGMYSSFDEIKKSLSLNERELNESKTRAKERYGKGVFSN